MKFIDLFAGIGGFRYGLESITKQTEVSQRRQAKVRDARKGHIQNHSKDNGYHRRPPKVDYECVWSNEWDKYASQIYKKHYGECDTKNIRTVKASEIPKHDLICAGFPCQSFSIAGKRKGFDDTRGTLFYEICRIARFHRTSFLLLENVKGLLNHDAGQTFSVILESLDELGYDCQWQVLNSKNFGVPQNRERVFIIGHLRGKSRPKVFPIRQGERENVSTKQKINQLNQPVHSNDRIYGEDGISPSLNTAQGGRRQPKVYMLGEHRTELGKKTRREIRKKEGRDSTLRGKSHKEYRPTTKNVANCLTTAKENVEKWLIKDMKIRRLTPTECERLQGFPDGWTEGISDTQRYKCLGNAVTTNVVRAIGEKLIRI